MPALSPAILDSSIRHQVLVERLKAGEIKKLLPFLQQIDRDIRLRLSGDELTGFARARLNALLADIEALTLATLRRYGQGLQQDLEGLALAEARFERKSLTNAINNPRFEAVLPADSQVLASAFSTPLSVRGPTGGLLLKPFVDKWTTAQAERITGAIRQGVFEGQTNAEMLKRIRGTRALRYSDGILNISKRQGEALVRTATQHVSSAARAATYEANGDLVKRYQWISTLDDRTSAICQGLSNTTWPVGQGPMPPAHINCRSTTVPLLDERFDFLKEGATQSGLFGPVDAKATYFDWLKKQPASFQDAALHNKTLGKLLRNGGLSAERFQQLRLSKDFKPLTLAEMQKLEPLAFDKAGINLNPETGLPIKRPRAG